MGSLPEISSSTLPTDLKMSLTIEETYDLYMQCHKQDFKIVYMGCKSCIGYIEL